MYTLTNEEYETLTNNMWRLRARAVRGDDDAVKGLNDANLMLLRDVAQRTRRETIHKIAPPATAQQRAEKAAWRGQLKDALARQHDERKALRADMDARRAAALAKLDKANRNMPSIADAHEAARQELTVALARRRPPIAPQKPVTPRPAEPRTARISGRNLGAQTRVPAKRLRRALRAVPNPAAPRRQVKHLVPFEVGSHMPPAAMSEEQLMLAIGATVPQRGDVSAMALSVGEAAAPAQARQPARKGRRQAARLLRRAATLVLAPLLSGAAMFYGGLAVAALAQ